MTVSRLHPLFQQILSMQDIIRAGEPAPAKARKRISCNACLDSGETSEGGCCNWCRAGEPDEPEEDY